MIKKNLTISGFDFSSTKKKHFVPPGLAPEVTRFDQANGCVPKYTFVRENICLRYFEAIFSRGKICFTG